MTASVGLMALAVWLRGLGFTADPLFYAYLEIIGSLLCLTYAANALVRFRGTHDRISLMLAFGFVISGLIEAVATFHLYDLLTEGKGLGFHVPLTWMVSRTLLAVVLVAALVIERRLPSAREPNREIAGAALVVAAVAYLTSALYLGSPGAPSIRPMAVLARGWELIPGGLFLLAALGFHGRLKKHATAFDRALFWAACANIACHLVASQSERLLDAPFTFAQILKVSSYALVLGGALVDNARLFEQVRELSVTDPLTGLANYRRLVQSLESEAQRSRRSGRPFALVLFDLDGLKSINDRYGHLVGSRAICRLANVLRSHCRATDVAARYGGDEFALILPEAGRAAAERVSGRVSARIVSDGELPAVSASAGVAVFPEDGDSIEKLIAAADRALYAMKRSSNRAFDLRRIAACL